VQKKTPKSSSAKKVKKPPKKSKGKHIVTVCCVNILQADDLQSPKKNHDGKGM